ncbi:hypothetical protein [Vibrio crassostreae]|uniref:Uncharacterized protein n=1 Tax=Vibrio crassostreae TaxID=246167 RepID=A0ABP1WPZ9_9VIBR|nr:hypothetical protein [Vibrio crassostreae]CAK2377178.1 conserved hypothetical protein [Vibrio crassostreae]CAK2377321.1 conserved hypothetical protein [Vibrio crassostreae]CAK2991636.1 conserved hypothetical protein [Vibrio crassostreae]CAK3043095.1 conserved hypothetical protein [Vibrio crassostreae]CDS94879.1 conserved hypothetical protein [Vibrio crassostreae]
MEDSRKWEFLLNGDSRLLRPFSEQLTNVYFDISGGVDHWHDCMNDDFRLSSIYFDEENSPETVWQIGFELISLFNGVCLILDPNHQRLTLEDLLHNGASVPQPEKRTAMAVLGEPDSLNKHIICQEFEDSKKRDIRLFMLNLATEREDVYLLLKYFDLYHDWVNYYKMYETIEAFSKITEIDIDVDTKLLKAFKNTANNYQFSGIQSRHGFKKTIASNKTPSMDLAQAHEFVATIAKGYLNKVANLVVNRPNEKQFKLPE